MQKNIKITKENLDSLISEIPNLLKGKYNKYTIILFSGAGGNHEEWDNIKPLKIYKQIKKHWPSASKYKHLFKEKLNFQDILSKITTTFSFTPFEYLLLNNIENKKNYPNIYPNNYFYNWFQIEYTLLKLIEIYNLKPPYIFIGFSEGGWRALYLQDKVKNCKGCILIDPQRYNKNTPENLITFDEYKKTKIHKFKKDKTLNSDSLNSLLSFYKYKNMINKFSIDEIKIKNPVIIFLNLYPMEDNYTDRFLSECEFTSSLKKYKKVKFEIFFDQVHFLHIIYYPKIINYLKLIK